MKHANPRPVSPRRARPVLGNPTYVTPHYHSRLWARMMFVLLIIGLAGVIGVGGGLYWAIHHAQGDSQVARTIHVGTGDSVTSVADTLQRDGLISNALVFRLDARLRGLATKLEVGDYTVRRNMSVDEMVTAFTIYHARTVSFTVPEGWRSEQIAARVRKAGMSAGAFLSTVHKPTFRLPILSGRPAGAGLEGYLFPDTYKLPEHTTSAKLAYYMVRQMGRNFSPAMRVAASKRGLSVFKVLILASIVEREAKVDSERPIIASVYENRMKQGMKLQADPTTQYALGTPRNWWPLLTRDQLTTSSPYNTYTNTGLPPGPIANPGLKSIRAVIYPQNTSYLFFVAKDANHHAFARTYAEQLQNQARYGH